jgi:hypothetical protein
LLGQTLAFLRQFLDEQLRVALGGSADDAGDALVTFLDSDKIDSLNFKMGAVTLALVNLEEERLLRSPDLYARSGAGGATEKGQPDIRLNLYLLLVSRFKDYDQAWEHLSRILSFLQTQRVMDHSTQADLPDSVEKLVFELVTQNFSEQSHMWGSLRSAALPSLLYRVRLLAFRDAHPTVPPTVTDTQHALKRMS